MDTKLRIGGSILLGVLLIAGAFFFSQKNVAGTTQPAVVVLNQNTREYQETKDTDGDGMRDWEEALNDTDPLIPNAAPTKEERERLYGVPTTTDTLPSTVTGRFARTFFEKYLRESLGNGSIEEAAQKTLLDGSINSVAAEVGDDFYTQANIHTTPDTSTERVRQYGNDAGAIFEKALVTNDNEVKILERALETSDPEELKKIEPIAAAYAHMLDGLLQLEAPKSLANEHMNLLNTVLAVHNDVVAMQHAFTDPLPALIRVKRYQNDAVGLYYAIENMRTAFEKEGITYTEGESGAFFFSFHP